MERDHLVNEKNRPQVYRPQGWVAPVVLINGQAAATWKHGREGDRLSVEVEMFGPISGNIITGIHAEAQDLGRFLGVPNVDVQIG